MREPAQGFLLLSAPLSAGEPPTSLMFQVQLQ